MSPQNLCNAKEVVHELIIWKVAPSETFLCRQISFVGCNFYFFRGIYAIISRFLLAFLVREDILSQCIFKIVIEKKTHFKFMSYFEIEGTYISYVLNKTDVYHTLCLFVLWVSKVKLNYFRHKKRTYRFYLLIWYLKH